MIPNSGALHETAQEEVKPDIEDGTEISSAQRGQSSLIKYVALLVLVWQNSCLILTMRYSRLQSSAYLPSTAVLLSEILKVFASIALATYEHGFKAAFQSVFSDDHYKLAIPAFLYLVQNSLQYVAVSHLDAPTFQVTYQLKILTTAFFSVVMLRRALRARQWNALIMLTIGVAIVQLPQGTLTGKLARSELLTVNPSEQLMGLVAVAIACILSGLAGVYFEKVLKSTARVSVWVRNIQLAMYSLVPALLSVFIVDHAAVVEHGFFYGYSRSVWATIMLQGFGGLLVSVCVKFADNILKNFATSLSIIVSAVGSVFVFNATLSYDFALGALLVLLATYIYNT